MSKIGNTDVIQFRSDSQNMLLGEVYEFKFGKKVVTETSGKKTVEKEVTDYDTVEFIPSRITPNECFSVEGERLLFLRK